MERYRALIEARITAWCDALPTDGLYSPMAYLLKAPAKRVRPALVLMGCELFGGRAEDALDEALAIELFHNFTLMHDDIMDASPLRRGMSSVHVKWNVNTAILSGDAMLVKAYELMGRNSTALGIFSRFALLVCEGQQLDIAFEKRADVHVDEYMEMIRLKTAVLLSCALRMGATIAGASSADRERIGAFGEHMGLAFQLRDDLLDAFGDPAITGKQRGGDLRSGKKTFLLIRGLERAAGAGTTVLQEELGKPAEQRDVERMMTVIEQVGARAEAEAEIARHNKAAQEHLNEVEVEGSRKAPLRALAAGLLQRAY